jgi:hypothetical protein
MGLRAWERLQGETTKAYNAWTVYRDMGVGRSIVKVAEQLGCTPHNVQHWSTRWDWQNRLQALEDYQELIRREALENAERDAAREVAIKQQELRTMLLDNAIQAAAQMREMLEVPLFEDEVVEVDNQGNEKIIRRVPARWNKNTIKRFHDVVAQAAGEVTERKEVRTYDLSQATDDQLERIADGEDPAKVLGDS